MRVRRATSVVFPALLGGWLTITTFAQQPRFPLPLEPIGNANEAIFPAYEGWGELQDGSGYLIVLGYKNRNRTETVEIPIGPNNKIEPGGPDYGQPTVFLPGRQTTIFAIKVPKNFGKQKLTWTLVANGQPAVVSFYLNPEYNLNFYKEVANGNEPPKMKLSANGPMMAGPQAGITETLAGAVGQPVTLKLWASDAPPTEKNWENVISSRGRKPPAFTKDEIAIVDGRVFGAPAARGGRGGGGESEPADITAEWTMLRGPGKVTINPPRVPMITKGNPQTVVEATATATFSAPGEYVLRAQPVEIEDGFDGLCCFSFANIKVVVK
jgi:hypothetical protein